KNEDERAEQREGAERYRIDSKMRKKTDKYKLEKNCNFLLQAEDSKRVSYTSRVLGDIYKKKLLSMLKYSPMSKRK
ncbi:hypothetical protein, partial [Neisseria meningitidis]|uniref:hypothetical protein n=1 Tax=Neisseria meningitidis TaxID=487 RepID=UPI000FEFC29A